MHIRSLIHFMECFQSEDDCRHYIESIRWSGEPACPHCGSKSAKHYKLKVNGSFNGLYKCKDCHSRFTVRQGTMFEGSNVSFKKWLTAIYLFLSYKKGISSIQLSKYIEVTQKTAWFMLHKIRHNLEAKEMPVFETETQVDETYVGGKHKYRKLHKWDKGSQGRSLKSKVPVMGLLSEGKVYTKVIPDAKARTLQKIIYELVKQGSTIVSDGWLGYKGLHKDFIHEIVDHSRGQYVRNGFHTNSIEGFWSLLKRGILGIYHVVSHKHLSKYCDEFVYRYNTRKLSDGERFCKFLGYANDRLKYHELTLNRMRTINFEMVTSIELQDFILIHKNKVAKKSKFY